MEMQRFEKIYEEHRPAVLAYVRRRAPDHLVEDVVADTFLVCLRRLDRVPPEPLPWLYAVARKTLANERRRRARQTPTDVLAPSEPEPAGDGALAAAFAQLGERDREVLRLVAWEGLSPGEAAVVLGCSAVACRVRFHRAKARLANRLEGAASFRPQPKGVTR
jgi:RNA polymerase sigma-70 factor (ECF subfamily)